MLCDRCGQREATHHDLVVNGADVHETHLCEVCVQLAAGEGTDSSETGEAPATLGDWLTNFVLTPPVSGGGVPGGGNPGKGKPRGAVSCDCCGLTFAELKKNGLVGCERCYEAFEERLVPLLQRAHEGGARHVGKRPRHWPRGGVASIGEGGACVEPGAAEPMTVAQEVESLRAALAEAVATEAYEDAARLRDRLETLLGGGSAGDADGGGV